MLYGALALVLGTVRVVVWHLGFATRALAPVFAEMMYARAPLIVLGPLALGCALGVLAALRQPSRTAAAVVGVEVLVAAGLAWIFLAYPFAARPTLRIAVGDRFPAFDLLDHRHFFTHPRFETGDPRYAWLNATFFIGEGHLLAGLGVEYRVWRPA